MGFWGRCCLLWHSFTVRFFFFLSNLFVHHSVDSILCLGLFMYEATHKGQERFYKGFSCCKHCQDGISADFLQFIQFKLTAWLHSYRSCATLRHSRAVGTAPADLNICLLSPTLTPCHISLGWQTASWLCSPPTDVPAVMCWWCKRLHQL